MNVAGVSPVDRWSNGERAAPDFTYVRYETIDDGRIATITLNRPKQRNAQRRGMLVELGAAFELAEADDTVRVVILRRAPALLISRLVSWVDDLWCRAVGAGV